MDFTDIELSGKTRREHDLLGEMDIPVEYYFGVQTMRAVEISTSAACGSTSSRN